MKAFDLAAGITVVLVIGLQAASGWALYSGEISFNDYVGYWLPATTLALGYWFKGAAQ